MAGGCTMQAVLSLTGMPLKQFAACCAYLLPHMQCVCSCLHLTEESCCRQGPDNSVSSLQELSLGL